MISVYFKGYDLMFRNMCMKDKLINRQINFRLEVWVLIKYF